MVLVSVDPGLDGAIIAWSEEDIVGVWDMPTIKANGKRSVDGKSLTNILHLTMAKTCVVEKVHSSPRQGVSSAFSFGRSFGIIEGVAHGLGMQVETVTPQAWKTYFGLLKKPKDAARLKAIGMFYSQGDNLKRKKDCDRADAMLIGAYFLRGSNV